MIGHVGLWALILILTALVPQNLQARSMVRPPRGLFPSSKLTGLSTLDGSVIFGPDRPSDPKLKEPTRFNFGTSFNFGTNWGLGLESHSGPKLTDPSTSDGSVNFGPGRLRVEEHCKCQFRFCTRKVSINARYEGGRSHTTRRCRVVDYPESYITKYTTNTKIKVQS